MVSRYQRQTVLAVGIAGLLVALSAVPGRAQIATVTFPDTAVGSTATVRCPAAGTGICFGANCSASGTLQGISGPGLPFAVSKLNLISASQYLAGSCETNPVSLPVTVGANQVLAYQASFAPSAAGAFEGTITFSTSGGPASVKLTGKGLAQRSDGGGVLLQANPDTIVPGGSLTLQSRTARGTLQGNVDLYLAILTPSGMLLFVNEGGQFTTAAVPFHRNFGVTDATQQLYSDHFPLDAAFGTYTFYMGMAFPGTDPLDPANWASALTSATVTYSPLSPTQLAIIQSRGNPDLLAVTWVEETVEKRETWIYHSGSPTAYRFRNGDLESEGGASGAGSAPVDPSLLTPQTTRQQLANVLGSPVSVVPLDKAPELEVVRWASGLRVVFRNGRMSSASTSAP